MSAWLLGLCGYAQSGKDTVAGILIRKAGARRLAFADRLKDVALASDPPVYVATCEGRKLGITHARHYRLSTLVSMEGWDAAKQVADVRAYLQRLGAAMREHVAEDVWLAPVLREAQDLRADSQPVVITDVRYPNEARAVVQAGGQVVRVRRPGVGPVNGDVSERVDALSSWISETLDNGGTMANLEQKVETLLARL